MKVGDRVKTKHDFLTNGEIIEDTAIGFVVRLDGKAPNEYAFNTREVLLFGEDLELEISK